MAGNPTAYQTMSQKYDGKIQWPRQSDYVLRVIDEEFTQSKSTGNPMIHLTVEVDRPEEVEIAGEVYMIAGQKCELYYVTKTLEGPDAEDKSVNNAKRVKDLYDLFELPSDNINLENPELGFKGKLVFAMMDSETKERRGSPTKEQLAKGMKQGDILKNPITGKPLIYYVPKVVEIFGLATADVGKPF